MKRQVKILTIIALILQIAASGATLMSYKTPQQPAVVVYANDNTASVVNVNINGLDN